MIENILLSLGLQLGDRKYFVECVSTNRQPFAQRGKQWKRCWLGCKCSILEDCSTRSRSLSERLDAFARNRVEDRASPFGACDFLYPCGEVFFLGRNYVCCSDLFQRGLFLRGSCGCNADCAF